MEIFGQFGVERTLFIAQVVNFLIVFYVLKRFMLKPIMELLKNRENTIKTGLKQAEEARVLLEQAAEKERTILKKAQNEAKTILSDAKEQSDVILTKAEERTRKQVEKMLSEAREQISTDTKEAEKRLAKNISLLAGEFLKKSVDELFTEKERDDVLGHALKTLSKKAD